MGKKVGILLFACLVHSSECAMPRMSLDAIELILPTLLDSYDYRSESPSLLRISYLLSRGINISFKPQLFNPKDSNPKLKKAEFRHNTRNLKKGISKIEEVGHILPLWSEISSFSSIFGVSAFGNLSIARLFVDSNFIRNTFTTYPLFSWSPLKDIIPRFIVAKQYIINSLAYFLIQQLYLTLNHTMESILEELNFLHAAQLLSEEKKSTEKKIPDPIITGVTILVRACEIYNSFTLQLRHHFSPQRLSVLQPFTFDGIIEYERIPMNSYCHNIFEFQRRTNLTIPKNQYQERYNRIIAHGEGSHYVTYKHIMVSLGTVLKRLGSVLPVQEEDAKEKAYLVIEGFNLSLYVLIFHTRKDSEGLIKELARVGGTLLDKFEYIGLEYDAERLRLQKLLMRDQRVIEDFQGLIVFGAKVLSDFMLIMPSSVLPRIEEHVVKFKTYLGLINATKIENIIHYLSLMTQEVMVLASSVHGLHLSSLLYLGGAYKEARTIKQTAQSQSVYVDRVNNINEYIDRFRNAKAILDDSNEETGPENVNAEEKRDESDEDVVEINELEFTKDRTISFVDVNTSILTQEENADESFLSSKNPGGHQPPSIRSLIVPTGEESAVQQHTFTSAFNPPQGSVTVPNDLEDIVDHFSSFPFNIDFDFTEGSPKVIDLEEKAPSNVIATEDNEALSSMFSLFNETPSNTFAVANEAPFNMFALASEGVKEASQPHDPLIALSPVNPKLLTLTLDPLKGNLKKIKSLDIRTAIRDLVKKSELELSREQRAPFYALIRIVFQRENQSDEDILRGIEEVTASLNTKEKTLDDLRGELLLRPINDIPKNYIQAERSAALLDGTIQNFINYLNSTASGPLYPAYMARTRFSLTNVFFSQLLSVRAFGRLLKKLKEFKAGRTGPDALIGRIKFGEGLNLITRNMKYAQDNSTYKNFKKEYPNSYVVKYIAKNGYDITSVMRALLLDYLPDNRRFTFMLWNGRIVFGGEYMMVDVEGNKEAREQAMRDHFDSVVTINPYLDKSENNFFTTMTRWLSEMPRKI